jgi:hypothetical protein
MKKMLGFYLSSLLAVRDFFFSVSNISCLAELADISHYHNCNKHSSRLVAVLKWSCSFHTRKNIDKRLSA